MSVRLAIGASRWRLVRQLLVEGVVLGAAGVAVAVGVAWTLMRAIRAIELPIAALLPMDLRLDARVLLFAAGAAGLSGLAASLVPALRASAPSLVADLRGGESAMAGAAGRRRFTLGEVLVAGQVALAVVLVVVASLLLRSFAATRATDLGFEARGVAIVSFDTEMVRYDAEQGRAFWRQALERVEAIPGVQAAALASPRVPLDVNFTTSEFQVEGRTYGEGERGEILNTVSVSPGYFDALRVPIVQGRLFAESDRPETPPVVIVSQEFVRRFWPEGGAIGRRVRLASAGRDYEVVGVVADYKVRTATERPTPYVHLAAWQRPSTYNYLIARSTGDADAMLVAMRRR
jgi:putative ABC transport system permease protein